MFRGKIAAVLALFALCSAHMATPALSRDKVITIPDQDAEMTAAISKARASLPDFWKAKKETKPGEDSFALKVRIPYGNGSGEHFWLIEIQEANGPYSGIISNDPNNATQVSKGQHYEFGETDITDWMFMRNGKMVGNETMRPLLKRMPKAQADQYREMYETP